VLGFCDDSPAHLLVAAAYLRAACDQAPASSMTLVASVETERSRASADGHHCRCAGKALFLLCHKFWCPFRAAQHGQRESVVARAATNLRRIVAIEFGTWRSGRNGGSSGLVTFA
jgi:hypothetical protein